MPVERICQRCGKKFLTVLSQIKVGKGKYCSKKCYQPTSINKSKCVVCGKFFHIKPSKIEKGEGRYCSNTCSGIAKRRKIKCICLTCGQPFEALEYDIKQRGRKFCSKVCLHKYWEGKWVKGKCFQCNKEFKYLIKGKRHTKAKFCSPECQGQYRIGKPLSDETKLKISKFNKIRFSDPTKTPNYGKHLSIETRAKLSTKQAANWCNPEYVKMMSQVLSSPTRPEIYLSIILENHFPDFKYNGDGRLGITLRGMRPDFFNVNGKKEVIEVFGDYWHSEKAPEYTWKGSELGRIMAYNSLGYRCLILWEHEINELTEEEIVDKIVAFTRGKK